MLGDLVNMLMSCPVYSHKRRYVEGEPLNSHQSGAGSISGVVSYSLRVFLGCRLPTSRGKTEPMGDRNLRAKGVRE